MPLERFAIIESTLREGEQFVSAAFSHAEKLEIARLLDAFGVEYLELTSPAASSQSRADCEAIAALGLRAKVLTHVRCHLDDARVAVETGVTGVNVVIGTSDQLRRYSHGKSLDEIGDLAEEVLSFLLAQGVEVRFSTEDSLRTDPEALYPLYARVDQLGVHRVGVADTVGIGTPRQIGEVVAGVRARVRADIEFHGHDDSGCAIANSLTALESGATHIDTSVLGIGERNGITPLGGLIARLYAIDPALVAHYTLPLLPELDRLVARLIGIEIPFKNPITGFAAFTHKAGIHTKAVLNHPATYEVLRPEDFGLSRAIAVGHRLMGWHAVRSRVEALGLSLSDDAVRCLTAHLKALADECPLSAAEVESAIYAWAIREAARVA